MSQKTILSPPDGNQFICMDDWSKLRILNREVYGLVGEKSISFFVNLFYEIIRIHDTIDAFPHQ
jgi:hypothetical protein